MKYSLFSFSLIDFSCFFLDKSYPAISLVSSDFFLIFCNLTMLSSYHW